MRQMDRRKLLVGAAATATTMMLAATPVPAAAGKTALTMHRSPSCGCCHKWADIAGRSGFQVTVANTDDIMAVKSRLGVPRQLMSCHTSQVGGYVVEGHVPMAAIRKLLREKPKGVVGIGLAGMPWGSPGMETADGHVDPLDIQAWDKAGNRRPFA